MRHDAVGSTTGTVVAGQALGFPIGVPDHGVRTVHNFGYRHHFARLVDSNNILESRTHWTARFV